MEPDISDQYNSVSEYIAHRLIIIEQHEERMATSPEKKQVNVRIPQHAFDKLVEVAGDVGESPSGLAADLLELAVYEAAGVQLVPSDQEADAK